MNVCSLIERAAEKDSARIAIINAATDRYISYGELHTLVLKVASGLLSNGVKEGDRVAIFLDNSEDFVIFFFAILRIGAIAVPIKTVFKEIELSEIFSNSDPRLVVIDENYIARCLSFLEGRTLIVNGAQKRVIRGVRRCIPFEELYQAEMSDNLPVTTSEMQLASINYTYRGFGYPLGAMLTHGTYVHGGIGVVKVLHPKPGERMLIVLPMSHIFTLVACVVAPLTYNGSMTILNSIRPKSIFACIEKYRIDMAAGVPTLYKILMDNYDRKFNLQTWNRSMVGGSYMSYEDSIAAEKMFNLRIIHGYGLTEYTPIIANRVDNYRHGTLGTRCHGVEIKIVSEDGRVCKQGEMGEILIRSPYMMQGYYKRKLDSDRVIKNGWLHTGDMGWKDQDGYYRFSGLKKEMVKVGGNSVDLKELGAALSLYQYTKQVKIEVVEDELWGCVTVARIESDRELNSNEIRAYLSDKLAGYKMPRHILPS